jgi:thiamine pyrophosphokinase
MKAVLVAGGGPQPADERWLTDADLVVAVDGGAAWLRSIGRQPGALVGDLDSVDPALVADLETAGVPIERHPTEKESSDTQLALAYALSRGATEAVIIGAFGGPRLDHEIANVLLLASARTGGGDLDLDLRLVRGGASVRALEGGSSLSIEARSRSLVSLLPVGGDASGVTTRGLRYPLDDERLPLGSTRGLSNEVVAEDASVQLKVGTLLVIETADEGERK